MTTLTWLHLSDYHACNPATGYDSTQVTNSLLEDLKKLEAQYGIVPDLLFFTGDAAFGEIPTSSLIDQYGEVAVFFDSIRSAFGKEIPKEHVFVVPGNHDVNRREVSSDQTEWLDRQRDTNTVTSIIRDNDRQWQRYMERLSDYREFLFTHGYKHLLEDPERLIYGQILQMGDVKIGIAGMNSAWSCCRDGEKSKIWMAGEWQINTLFQKIANTDISIGLIHHPSNWFVESEDPFVGRLMEKNFNFLLHGHEHTEWLNEKANGFLSISAAACYEHSKKGNGYNVVRLDTSTGQCTIWFRRFDSTGCGWVSRPIANIAEDGIYQRQFEHLVFHPMDSKYVPRQVIPSRSLPEHSDVKRLKQFPNFTTLKNIGHGSFGTVYLVKQNVTGRMFAVKHFSPYLFEESRQKEAYLRFRRGVRYMQKLAHPGVVKVYHFIDDGMDDCYYLMDFYELGNLDKFILKATDGTTQWGMMDKLSFVLSLCDAITFAHTKDIVHRDIKPSNILVSKDGVTGNVIPKLADFDLAYQLGDTGLTQGDFGSIHYLPPEIRTNLSRIENQRLVNDFPGLSNRSVTMDIYALAGVMYRLFCNCHPPLGNPDSVYDEYEEILQNASDSREKSVLKALAVVVRRALSETAEERPQTVVDFTELIQRAISAPKSFHLHYNAHFEKKDSSIYSTTEMKHEIEREALTEEIKVLQNQLSQAQKMEAVSRLSGGIAHDFNNILAAIMGYSAAARADIEESSPIAEDLAEIQNAAQRGQELTRQLLAFSRKTVLDPTPIDLIEAIESFIQMFARIIGENIRIEFSAEATDSTIAIDKTQVQQILANLAVNAADAMPDGGTIYLSTKRVTISEFDCQKRSNWLAGRFICLSFKDDGCGIAPEYLNKIFEPFFTTKGAGKASGLGLSVVFGVIKNCGGFIDVESKITVGTTFKLYFPYAEPKLIDDDSLSMVKNHLVAKSILLGELEPAIKRVLARLLRQQQCEIVEADNENEVWEYLKTVDSSIDLLIMDLGTFENNGSRLADKVCNTDRSIPILFISSIANQKPELSFKCKYDFLPAPFTREALLKKISFLTA